MTLTEQQARPRPNWKQVTTFLGLTFGLTYLLDLVLYLTGGYGGSSATLLLLQVQMLIPACVAIVLQVFVYKDSPIYHVQDRTRWFFYGYLVYALIQLGIAVSALLITSQTYQIIASAVIQLLLVVFLLLLVLLRLVAGKEAFQKAGLAGGKFWYYISFGIFLVAIYAVMTGLNALFGLGRTDEAELRFREIVALNPNFGNAWQILGQILDQVGGKDEEAQQCFVRAKALGDF